VGSIPITRSKLGNAPQGAFAQCIQVMGSEPGYRTGFHKPAGQPVLDARWPIAHRDANIGGEYESICEDICKMVNKRMRGQITLAMAGLVAVGVVIGVVAVGTTTWMVNATSTDDFCATACHNMTWAAESWEASPHYGNPVAVHASCSDCHIPYENEHPTPFQYVTGTLWTKGVSGAEDIWGTLLGTIRDEAKWNAMKPRLNAQVKEFFRKTGSRTCQGCHELGKFEGTAAAAMAEKMHATMLDAEEVVCIECHNQIAHVY
jgi:cytochrome c-type protein NapC